MENSVRVLMSSVDNDKFRKIPLLRDTFKFMSFLNSSFHCMPLFKGKKKKKLHEVQIQILSSIECKPQF